jgi:hypothetical protein
MKKERCELIETKNWRKNMMQEDLEDSIDQVRSRKLFYSLEKHKIKLRTCQDISLQINKKEFKKIENLKNLNYPRISEMSQRI